MYESKLGTEKERDWTKIVTNIIKYTKFLSLKLYQKKKKIFFKKKY